MYLEGNQLTSLPAEIGQLTSLRKLDLSRNQLTSLPAEIWQLTSLEELYLKGNQLTSLPAEIGQLTSLETLALTANQLTSLPAEIWQLTSLRSCTSAQSADELAGGDRAAHVAGGVGPHGQSADELAGGDLAAHLAETLDLSDNQLTSLPAEIGQLTSLEDVGPLPQSADELPAEIGQLTSLEELDLERQSADELCRRRSGSSPRWRSWASSGNQLTSVPAEIWQLTSLRSLDLSDNQLTSSAGGDRAAHLAGGVDLERQSADELAGGDTRARSGGLRCGHGWTRCDV